MDRTWLTREEGAEWLKCSESTVTHIVNEMEAKGLPGVWRDRGHFLRVNQEDMNEYLRRRNWA